MHSVMRRHLLPILALAVAAGAFAAAPPAGNEPAEAVRPWSFILLPDTQHYTSFHPEVFARQTEWIVANEQALNLKFVLQLGDLTDNNADPEWLNARHAIDTLRRARIPYLLASGNHDIGIWGNSSDRRTRFGDYFHGMDYGAPNLGFRPWNSVGFFQRGQMENAYVTKEIHGTKFLLLSLEFGPRHAVVEWANKVVAEHPGHFVILVTHAYLYSDSTRYDWAAKGRDQKWSPHAYPIGQSPEGVNDGEQLWQKLVKRHRGFLFTFNGHVGNDGTGYLVSRGDHGQEVHQMLANYQTEVDARHPDGGGGFLRILTVAVDGRSVDVRTYSPHLDRWLTEADHQFVMTLDRSLHDAP